MIVRISCDLKKGVYIEGTLYYKYRVISSVMDGMAFWEVIYINSSFANTLDEDLLKYAIETGIISLNDIRDKKHMEDKNKIIEDHPYSIWEGSNGYWYTYLPDDTRVNGRLIKKKKTEEEIRELIINFYHGSIQKTSTQKIKTRPKKFMEKDTFKVFFNIMVAYKMDILNLDDNTIAKYKSDYNRFFKDSSIENLDIRKIDDETLTAYIIKRIHELGLTKRSAKDMMAYMSMVFDKALKKKVITENPFKYIDKAIFTKHYRETKVKTAQERTVSDEQMALINARFEYYHAKNPRYIPVYAVELATLTGFRVGELAALRWDRIQNGQILIDSSEKYNRVTQNFYIDKTKNGKSRYFPVSEEIENLLKRIYDTEKKYGYLGEYVFMDEDGRVHNRRISDCARNLCLYMGMDVKSIHTFRRTVSSKLKCMGVATPIVASLMGHTEEVNENNYTYDVSNYDMKKDLIAQVTKNISSAKVS